MPLRDIEIGEITLQNMECRVISFPQRKNRTQRFQKKTISGLDKNTEGIGPIDFESFVAVMVFESIVSVIVVESLVSIMVFESVVSFMGFESIVSFLGFESIVSCMNFASDTHI